MNHTVTFYRDGECLIEDTIHNKALLKDLIGLGITMLSEDGTLRVMDAEENVALNYTMSRGEFYCGRYSIDAYKALMEEIV